MILVDTSVWIDHFRCSSCLLVKCLENAEVLIHPWVIGELACGNLQNRRGILRLLNDLPGVVLPSHEEAMIFLERHSLMGRGIGYVDLHLLTATALTEGASLWTSDKRLRTVARELGLHFMAQ